MKTNNPQHTMSVTQFDTAMRRYATATQREAEITKTIEAGVNDLLAAYQAELDHLADDKRKAFDTARSYCMANKQQVFAKRRSIGTIYGIAGFRLGAPRLKTAAGTNWNAVVAALKVALPEYVRTKDEPAKDLLLADRHTARVAPILVALGVEVVQEDLFYITTGKAA